MDVGVVMDATLNLSVQPFLPSMDNPDYSPRKHKMSKRACYVESDQRVTGYPQKTAGTRPG